MADNRPVVSNLDFDDLKADMIQYFKQRPEFADYEFTGSSLNLLMDILAYNTHYNSLAANFLVNEMFLDTALMRNNVTSIAKMLNYTPRSASAATANITLSVPRQGTERFNTVPAGSVFTASSGNTSFNFYLLEDGVVQYEGASTSENITVTVKEGTLLTQRFVMSDDQLAFPAFTLMNSNVDRTSVTVTVNNETYTQILPENEGITGVDRNSRIFFVEETRELNSRIVFGNGVIGNKPDVGDVIVVTYLVTSGEVANGISTFSAGVIGRPDVAIVSNTVAQGGGQAESIREIKDNAPHWYQAQYRAVTENDYEVLLKKNYSDIQSVNVYGGETVGQPGKVFFSIKPKSADRLSDAAKQTIANDILSKYNIVTVTPVVVDPIIMKIVVKSVIQYDAAKLTTTRGAIQTSAFNLFDVLNTDYIGGFLKNFKNSRLINEMLGLDDAITSVNNRISMRFDNTASNRALREAEWSFGNKLYHPFDGYKENEGGILTTNLFRLVGANVDSGFDDDGRGNVRLFNFVDGQKLYVNRNAGTINYDTGDIVINTFNPADGDIEFTVVTDSFDILARENVILEIATEDSQVTVVDETATQTLNNINVNRSA